MGKMAVDEDLIAQIVVAVAELEGKVTALKALVDRLVKGG
jgi:hypothetical protein